MTAGGGTRDLLALHIPMAIVVMGLSIRLFERTGRSFGGRRTTDRDVVRSGA